MKSFSNKSKKFRIVSLLIFFAIVGILLLSPSRHMNKATQGMRQVKSYEADGICLAIDNPECGYCPGEVEEGKCYVKQGVLEQFP